MSERTPAELIAQCAVLVDLLAQCQGIVERLHTENTAFRRLWAASEAIASPRSSGEAAFHSACEHWAEYDRAREEVRTLFASRP